MSMVFELTDNSQQVIAALGNQKALALEDVGMTAEGYVRDKTPVDTSNLQNSITHIVDDNAVTIGTNVDYAQAVEFGHKQEVGRYVPAIGKRLKRPFVQGKHFMRDGITTHLGDYKRIIKDYLTR